MHKLSTIIDMNFQRGITCNEKRSGCVSTVFDAGAPVRKAVETLVSGPLDPRRLRVAKATSVFTKKARLSILLGHTDSPFSPLFFVEFQ